MYLTKWCSVWRHASWLLPGGSTKVTALCRLLWANSTTLPSLPSTIRLTISPHPPPDRRGSAHVSVFVTLTISLTTKSPKVVRKLQSDFRNSFVEILPKCACVELDLRIRSSMDTMGFLVRSYSHDHINFPNFSVPNSSLLLIRSYFIRWKGKADVQIETSHYYVYDMV